MADPLLAVSFPGGFRHGKPSCWHQKKGACGGFDDGALLIDEYKH